MSENNRIPKRRGRPPKSESRRLPAEEFGVARTDEAESAAKPAASAVRNPAEGAHDPQNTQPAPKRRGRPPKNRDAQAQQKTPADGAAAAKQTAPVPQTAPAAQKSAESAQNSQNTQPAPKRRGRPPKNRTAPAQQPAEAADKQPAERKTIRADAYHAGGTRRSARTKTAAPDRAAPEPTPVPQPAKPRSISGGKLRIIPLGGLNEIGKNVTLYEYGDDIIVVDCGMSFPEEEMLGVDIVMPDLSYLFANKHRVRGVFITHGHEDHIGAVAYMCREMNPPIYATPFARGLIEGKLEEASLLRGANLVTIHPGERVRAGVFEVEAINVNHSTPDAVSYAITTPAGVVIQTGDFKIDSTPIAGDMIDLARFGEYGRRGVLALLSDSTNVERPGFTMSERAVGETLAGLFRGCHQRIIITTFASNVHRIQQVIDAAVANGRKVAITGRSMEKVMALAVKLGYVDPPAGTLIDIDSIKSVTPSKLVIVTTGSQGETLSALSRMAFGTHRQVSVGAGDRVIISASSIPGNENSISRVINELMRRGADVVYRQLGALHVSGHACQEELKVMLGLVKPTYFMPVHGEYKMLRTHADLARQMGVSPKNIIIGENGRVVEFGPKGARLAGSVPAGQVLLDGALGNDIGDSILRDRKILSEDGVVVAAVTVDTRAGQLLAAPEVIARGFVAPEGRNLMRELEDIVAATAEDNLYSNDLGGLRSAIRSKVSDHIWRTTRCQPLVITIVSEA